MKQITIFFEIPDYGCNNLIDDNLREKLKPFVSPDSDISNYNLNFEIILDSEVTSDAIIVINDVDLGTSGNGVYVESKFSLNKFFEYSGKIKEILVCQISPGTKGQITFYF